MNSQKFSMNEGAFAYAGAVSSGRAHILKFWEQYLYQASACRDFPKNDDNFEFFAFLPSQVLIDCEKNGWDGSFKNQHLRDSHFLEIYRILENAEVGVSTCDDFLQVEELLLKPHFNEHSWEHRQDSLIELFNFRSEHQFNTPHIQARWISYPIRAFQTVQHPTNALTEAYNHYLSSYCLGQFLTSFKEVSL